MSDGARWLSREALARHLSLRPSAIARMVRDGRLPPPNMALGSRNPRWDQSRVDALFDGGLASTDPSQAIHAAAQEIRQGR